MEVKVQCACGVKYAFDVEPINGQLPVPIACPQCGADGTAYGNSVIAQKLAQEKSAPPPTRLRVAHEPAKEPAAAPAAIPVDVPSATLCSKHPRIPATERCVVCGKPICPECMSLFGYLCSIHCRYQAEQQKIDVPVYEGQKTVVAAKQWRKVGLIAGSIALVIVLLIGCMIWYEAVGSRPRPIYTMQFSGKNEPLHAQLFDAKHLLLLYSDRLALHDIKGQKDAWSFAIKESAEPSETEPGNRDFFQSFNRFNPEVFATKDTIWLCQQTAVVSIDPKTGSEKSRAPIEGRITHFSPHGDALFVVSSKQQTKRVTRIEIASGAAKTEDLAATPTRTQEVTVDMPPGFVATAGYMLAAEFADESDRRAAMRRIYSQTIPAGPNAVEMKVKLVQPNLVMVESIKKTTESALNANTSASTSAGLVAEEVFNDIKRSRGGGYKRVDESTYQIILKRVLNGGAQEWVGQVTGPPAFYAMKTVDVLTGGKSLYIFDKNNKQLANLKLTYPVGEHFQMAGSEPACLETDDTLYFFDQGVLTALALPSCDVRWRLTSVGISKVISDGKGHLYVNTTSGSRDDIQYSDQIKITDAAVSQLLKVDAKSGTILWKSSRKADCCLSGKFLYAANSVTGGFGLTEGLREALNPLGGFGRSSSSLRIYRLNPSNGREEWEYYNQSSPLSVDFHENRIALVYGDHLEVLRFLSF